MKIGILTDIHENVDMLQKSLDLAALNRCDEIVCLGDIIGYDKRFYRYDITRSARRCLNLVRLNCKWIVAGNHDLFSSGRVPSWSDGFEFPENWFNMKPSERKSLAGTKVWCYEGDSGTDMGEDEILFLKSLPENIITDEPGTRCNFSHYFYPDLTGSTTHYAEKGKHLTGHWEFMDRNKVLYSFSGHTHNHLTGFAYRDQGLFFRAFHNLHNDRFYLGKEKIIIALPPLSGEKGRTGFSIFDSDNMILSVINFSL